MPARRTARAARGAAPQLSEQEVVDAALRLIRKVGGDKLSMRALAAQLGVTPMAIYYHVPNKEALLDLVVDAVLASVPMPTPSRDRWQAQMKSYAVTGWQLVNSYPDLSRIMLSRTKSKSGLALTRYGISILLAAGFEPRDAAMAIAAFNTYMYGAYAFVSAYPQFSKGAPRKAVDAKRSNGGSEAGVGAVANQLRQTRLEDALDYGIDAMLAGIGARAPKRGARGTHS